MRRTSGFAWYACSNSTFRSTAGWPCCSARAGHRCSPNARAPTAGRIPLFQDYLRGLYLLDPFYIASRENPCSGLFRLADVAPECFEQTDYYQRYFRLNVVADEIQINVQLSGERTLCLSLGSRRRFTPEQLAVLGLVRPWVAGLMRQRLAFEDEVLNSPAAPEPGWQGSLEKVAEQMGTPLTARELEVGRLMLSGCSSRRSPASWRSRRKP